MTTTTKLSRPQQIIVAAIENAHTPPTQREIAAAAHYSVAYVNQLLSVLLCRHCIERELIGRFYVYRRAA